MVNRDNTEAALEALEALETLEDSSSLGITVMGITLLAVSLVDWTNVRSCSFVEAITIMQ